MFNFKEDCVKNSCNDCLILCNKCQKSKRPSIDTIKQLVENVDELNIKSNETIGINLLFKRINFWQQNCCDILKSSDLTNIVLKLDNIENFVSQISQNVSFFEP